MAHVVKYEVNNDFNIDWQYKVNEIMNYQPFHYYLTAFINVNFFVAKIIKRKYAK